MSDIETGLLQLGAGGPCPVDTLATSKSPERRRSATFHMSGSSVPIVYTVPGGLNLRPVTNRANIREC